MKHLTLCLILALTLLVDVRQTFAQGTAFTYQGRLNDGINPAHGVYDFRFKLFEDPLGNTQAGSTILTNGIVMTNGLFMVAIDFGAGIFNGSHYWLEVDVRTNGAGSYANLNPLQPVTPTPYAIFANTASNLTGTISAANLSGTYGNVVTLNNGGNSFSGSFAGNGANVTDVNAVTLGGLSAANFWKTTGNAGTTAGANFVGTTDNQPLELHVNGQRVVRFEPTATNGAVNVIGGSPNNYAAPGVVGATIGGGGAGNYAGASYTNRVMIDFGTVSGGYANLANGYAAVVSGGYNNANNGFAGFIGAGDGNTIVGNGGGDGAFLGGGYSNTNGGEAATIVGGTANFVGTFANNAFIGGGAGNSIVGSYVFPGFGTIGGGQNNRIQTNAAYDTIGGGYGNIIQASAHNSFVGGGSNNVIQSGALFATIGGGVSNSVGGAGGFIGGGGFDGSTLSGNYAGTAAVVGGGIGNSASFAYATIGGGQQNKATYEWDTVGGGQQNTAGNGGWDTVGGGIYNTASGLQATVAGGANNTASGTGAFIGGGGDDGSTLAGNQASGTASVVTGGAGNNASGFEATVPGGGANTASGSYSFAAGKNATASHSGAFVWSDGLNFGFDPYAQVGPQGVNNSFNVRSTGGFYIVTGVDGSGTITAGAYLAASATSWSTLSDRNAKKNFAAINYEAVLDKLAQIPVKQWNYKWEKDSDTPNLGPMAQDFIGAFYPGRDDKSISTLEFDGVELAAIQGLNQKLNEKDAEIQQLKQSVAQLQALVSQMAKSGPDHLVGSSTLNKKPQTMERSKL